MADVSLSPSSLVVAGAIVSSSNPLPVTVVSGGISSSTFAALPAASASSGSFYWVSNAGTGGSLWRSNGTRWKAVGVAMFASLDTAVSGVANAESIAFQYLIPAGVWQTADRLRLRYTMTKSGTTDTGTMRFRCGTAGTTGDTQLFTATMVAAGSRTTAVEVDFRLESATSVQQLAASAASQQNIGYSGTNSNAPAAAVTITSAAANALFFSIGILSSSTNDTVGLLDAQLALVSTPN